MAVSYLMHNSICNVFFSFPPPRLEEGKLVSSTCPELHSRPLVELFIHYLYIISNFHVSVRSNLIPPTQPTLFLQYHDSKIHVKLLRSLCLIMCRGH